MPVAEMTRKSEREPVAQTDTERTLLSVAGSQEKERLAWIMSYRGKYKGVFTPVDEFIRKRNRDEL